MVVGLSIFLALIIGLIAGGSLENLARLQIRWWPVLLVAVALQAYSVGHWATDTIGPVPVRTGAFVATHALILGVALANVRLTGVKVVVLGAASNLVALLANGGLMPVSPEARVAIGHQATVDSLAIGSVVMGSKGVVVPPEQANLWPLTDIFVLPPPFPVPAVCSIGDVLVAVGLGYLIVRTMRSRPVRTNGGSC